MSHNDHSQVRCTNCTKLLANKLNKAGLEIKCLRCAVINRIPSDAADQVVITDKNGVILFVNDSVERITGYSEKESLGKKISELWGGHMSKEFYEFMWHSITNESKQVKFNVMNKKKTGESYQVELIVTPIRDPNGEIIFFVGIESVL